MHARFSRLGAGLMADFQAMGFDACGTLPCGRPPMTLRPASHGIREAWLIGAADNAPPGTAPVLTPVSQAALPS